jgi:uncharacterized membrane protein YgdD (TMEM256/DUF423 family)
MSTSPIKNRWVSRGALLSGVAVALSAFGSHFLKNRIDGYYLDVFKTGTQYQFFHGIALVLFGIWAELSNRPDRIGWFFFIGTLLFSTSLYLLSFTGIKILGSITPIGGILIVLGWLLFARAAR